MAGQALLARPAEHREARDHMIAGLHVRHQLADLLDDPGGLMSEHGRRGIWVQPIDEVEVAVADTRRRRVHEHFARHRLIDVNLLDREWLMRPVENGSFHG